MYAILEGALRSSQIFCMESVRGATGCRVKWARDAECLASGYEFGRVRKAGVRMMKCVNMGGEGSL